MGAVMMVDVTIYSTSCLYLQSVTMQCLVFCNMTQHHHHQVDDDSKFQQRDSVVILCFFSIVEKAGAIMVIFRVS